MEVEIYADVVFLINFFMDFFIFWITNKIMKKGASCLRLLFGAFFAAMLYCGLIFINVFNIFYNFFGILFVLSVSVFIAFFPKSPKEFIKTIFMVNVSAFALGGTAMGLFYYTNVSKLIGNALDFTTANFSFKILLASTCFFYIAAKLIISFYKRFLKQEQCFMKIKIEDSGKTVLLNALVDTGNSLHEPISKKPVIVAQFSAVKEFLPNEIKILYYENNELDLEKIYKGIANSCLKFRVIPFSSIGKKDGLIIGFIAERALIFMDEKEIIVDNPIIGICNFELSCDGFYAALLNPEILS